MDVADNIGFFDAVERAVSQGNVGYRGIVEAPQEQGVFAFFACYVFHIDIADDRLVRNSGDTLLNS